MRIPIRTRILLLFIGITFIQAILLAAFFLSQHSRLLHSQVNNQLTTITDAISNQIISYLEGPLPTQQLPTQQMTETFASPFPEPPSGTPSQKGDMIFAAMSSPTRSTATFNHDILQAIIDKEKSSANQNIFILNSQGSVVAKKEPSTFVQRSFPPDRNWSGEVLIDGTHFIATSSSLYVNGQKLLVIGAINKQTALTPALKTFKSLVFLLLLLFLFSLLIGWTTRRHIITPLQRLAGFSSTILQGKSIDISLQGDAELKDLAQAMNTMNKELQDSNKTLKREILLRDREEKKAIQARIDAEKTSQAKSIFLANMSHEIRTPLQAMIGLLNMLNKGPLNNEQKKLLAMAAVSGQRLQTLVHSILDLSQIESGHFQLHHSVFTLSSLITEVTELMQIHANEKNLHLKTSQDPAIPDTLKGDSGRIRQILINLLNNSIKYTDRGGIYLTVELSSVPNNKEIELLFSIKDSGRGISSEIRETIFDPFAQGKIDPDRVTEGIGLGLAISNEFVHYMQGRIWLQKSDENGSTFCFTIRCEKAEEALPDPEKKPEATKKKLTAINILLADDEFINQRIVSAYLEELGATVSICENGQELLEKMALEIPDIILMDICMPVLDGIKTTKIIRDREAKGEMKHIPIIALTAQATTTFKAKCKEAGMDNYVTKPIPFDDLTRIICELHEDSETHSSSEAS